MESSPTTKYNEIQIFLMKRLAMTRLLDHQKPLLEEPGSSGGNGGHADKFKRPLLDDLPPSNKRVKV